MASQLTGEGGEGGEKWKEGEEMKEEEERGRRGKAGGPIGWKPHGFFEKQTVCARCILI